MNKDSETETFNERLAAIVSVMYEPDADRDEIARLLAELDDDVTRSWIDIMTSPSTYL